MKELISKTKLWVTANRTTALLVTGIVALLVGGLLLSLFFLNRPQNLPIIETEVTFNPEGPYAVLEPRRDGNALILNLKRVSGYDSISYELAYQSEVNESAGEVADEDTGGKIDRGVQGTVNTTDKKNEYSQEVLFGTCSKGDTFSTLHCVFDKSVENGTLILRIQKKNLVDKINTTWHLQRPDVALGEITSGDGHFSYKTTVARDELVAIGFTIVNDLSGSPKLPDGKQFLGKVYAFNVPSAKTFPAGAVTIELAETPPADAQIGVYIEADNEWKLLDTKIDSSTLTASAPSNGIFAVFTPASK